MISFNSSSNSQQSNTGVLIHQHITVQAAADVKGIKIGQMWLIDIESLGKYLEHVEQTSDRRCGPR
jgi:hypothetical protein